MSMFQGDDAYYANGHQSMGWNDSAGWDTNNWNSQDYWDKPQQEGSWWSRGTGSEYSGRNWGHSNEGEDWASSAAHNYNARANSNGYGLSNDWPDVEKWRDDGDSPQQEYGPFNTNVHIKLGNEYRSLSEEWVRGWRVVVDSDAPKGPTALMWTMRTMTQSRYGICGYKFEEECSSRIPTLFYPLSHNYYIPCSVLRYLRNAVPTEGCFESIPHGFLWCLRQAECVGIAVRTFPVKEAEAKLWGSYARPSASARMEKQVFQIALLEREQTEEFINGVRTSRERMMENGGGAKGGKGGGKGRPRASPTQVLDWVSGAVKESKDGLRNLILDGLVKDVPPSLITSATFSDWLTYVESVSSTGRGGKIPAPFHVKCGPLEGFGRPNYPFPQPPPELLAKMHEASRADDTFEGDSITLSSLLSLERLRDFVFPPMQGALKSQVLNAAVTLRKPPPVKPVTFKLFTDTTLRSEEDIHRHIGAHLRKMKRLNPAAMESPLNPCVGGQRDVYPSDLDVLRSLAVDEHLESDLFPTEEAGDT